MSSSQHLLIFGPGYSGAAVATAARAAGFQVTGTVRDRPADGTIPFDAAEPAIATATHLLSSVPPDGTGDLVLTRYAPAIAAAPRLRWIGYLSSTVVYGDRDGGWVDEDTPPAPSQDRGHHRLAAEQAWCGFAFRCAVDLFRLAGIYGPGRSSFDALRAGRAARIVKSGHAFGRIHRDDIAGAVLAAMQQNPPPGRRIFNLTDDEPAETAVVLQAAAELLGIPPPPAIPFANAVTTMSPMARSFWAENRKVASRKTRAMLGYTWRYPSYREGLRAILTQEGT
jgi:nucleoside-diphosphate-sugar epimerase